MSTLLYRGFDDDGQRISGAGSFASETQLKDYLHNRGVDQFESFKSDTTYKSGAYKFVSPKELSVFCKQISVMIYSQILLMEGVSLLAEQTENKHLKLALNEIYGFMGKGFTFAEAMGMYDHIFSTYLLNMIEIGEASGSLDTVFAHMSAYFNKEHMVRRRIRQAVTYPAVLTSLMAAIIVLLIAKILPMFNDILESMGTQIPAAAQAILNVGSFLVTYAPVILLVILAAIVAWIIYVRTDKGRLFLDKAKFNVPAYRYIQSRVISARFARSLSILLKSGAQLLNALLSVSKLMDNRFLEDKLVAAADEIKNGLEPAEALAKINLFPGLFMKMFIIGYKTGNLDEMLDKTASVFDDEADDAIERFTGILEPALIIVLSVIVGIILLSVMIPMISIMNAIG